MYFISKSNKKEGPFSLEEVLKLNLTDDTLVWKEGMTDWSAPSQLPELAQHVIKTPPPLPVDVQKKKEQEWLEEKRNKASKIILSNSLTGLIIGLLLAGLATIGGASGGSSALPVYLTHEERNNPALLFWHFLPLSLLIAEVMMLGVSLYQIISLKPQQIPPHEKAN
jgi:hypothetical protein